jgi:hypothetical protein
MWPIVRTRGCGRGRVVGVQLSHSADRASRPGRLTVGRGEGEAAKPIPSPRLSILAGASRGPFRNFAPGLLVSPDFLFGVSGEPRVEGRVKQVHDFFFSMLLRELCLL